MTDFWNRPPDGQAALYLVSILILAAAALLMARQNGRPRPKRASSPAVMMLAPNEPLSLAQTYAGVVFVSETGGGKSSTAERLACGLMEQGASFLWLAAKVDEFQRVKRLVARRQWQGRLVRFAPDEPHRFSPIDYELTNGGSVDSVAHLLGLLVEADGRAESQSNERFWGDATTRHLRNLVALCVLGRGKVSFNDLYKLLVSAPNAEQVKNAKWRAESFMAQCLVAAAGRHEGNRELELVGDYFLQEWAELSEKTRSVIYTMCVGVLSKFVAGPMAHLVSGESTITPDDLIREPTIVVVDAPYLRDREPGRHLALCWKILTQRAVLRRNVAESPRPVCVWQDEYPLFALPSVDVETQTVARSHRLISCAMFQSLPVLYAALGGSEKAKHEAHALIGNHITRFIGSLGSCKDSAEFFSAVLGSSKQLMFGGGTQSSQPYDLVDDVMGTGSSQAHANFNEQILPDVRPEDFGKLARGGPDHGCVVEMYCHQSGRKFRANGGKPWIKAAYRQMV